MLDDPQKAPRKVALIQLVPNVMTVAAVCAGMTAIRFAIQGHVSWAVGFILLAAVLDGLDGRMARLVNGQSEMGAELDSLADFLNFGVAPAFILYFWGLQDLRSLGWLAALTFAICCLIRLARFNVGNKSEQGGSSAHFVGVPAPAGALLALVPIYLDRVFVQSGPLPDGITVLYLMLVAFLLISRIPTPSFKTTRVHREHVKYVLVAVGVFGAAFVTYVWLTLLLCSVAYLVLVALGALRMLRD
ncbi:CDP-diacylglycerol---serine O-phosphatidyltransferase [Aliiroseovarius crassostreae]|uniref:CDP-diacylglycerol--serine O-phosphatidyltransferase n=1 Tax=Aliiroseovarius crassostreae TaxID=154981 RepID=A0A0N8IBB8_9RHOB|nr:CDP-diacylglycerol--serine O-phosphatidyltransferase [Aliiroseovarius crassostreae]KPN62667.1 CDP-diacylglycerol--serine O-phosphatidyltransferase [Aliiroseovarius crassostreae]SFU94622.1 CDP-diacylglycerol---serine O-phosphatidyltransferase [Aliiroseovarius crassostreae]